MEAVDDNTLDFTLRQGVTFQNGDKFSADDVVYTFNSVLNDKTLSVPSNYQFIAGVEKLDDYHVRIKLKRVFPAALEYFAMVLPIWPQAYREKVGVEQYSKQPIGAGPYRITRVDGTTEIDMERYDGYYAGSPKGKPPIRFIKIHEVPDAATEMADLHRRPCRLDLGLQPRPVDSVARTAEHQALRAETMRIAYLQPGRSRPYRRGQSADQGEGASGDRLCARSRHHGQAVDAGQLRPLDAPCFPTQFGCDAGGGGAIPVQSRQGEAVAGGRRLPQRFRHRVGVLPAAAMEGAVQNYLGAVGINAHMTQLAGWRGGAACHARAGAAEFRQLGQLLDQRRVGDPAVFLHRRRQRLCARSGGEQAGDRRRQHHGSRPAAEILQPGDQADHRTRRLAADVYLREDLRFSRQLNFKPYPDELPRFYLSSWK